MRIADSVGWDVDIIIDDNIDRSLGGGVDIGVDIKV